MSRILLVDDDIAEISAVKRVLLRGGHQPVLATNASDASASIARDPPELLLVSSTCESGGALALVRNLPAGRGGANLPLLVLGEAGGLPQGARHLPRPLDPEQLAAEVKAALGPAGALSVSDLPPPPPPPRITPVPAGEPIIPTGRITLPLGMVAESLLPPPRSGRTTSGGPSTPQPWAPPQAAPARTDGLSQAMASRRAAADALRARAEQLRRSAGTPVPLPPPAAARAPAPAPAPADDEGLELEGPILLDDPAADEPGPEEPALEAPDDDEPAPELPASALELEELGPPDPTSLFRPPPDLQATIDDAELDAAFREAVVPARAPAGQVEAEPAPELAPVEAAEPTALEAREQATDEALRALEEEATTHAAERARARATAGPAGLEGFAEAAGAERRALEEAVEVARREGFEAARRELEEQARREAAEAARQAEVAARSRLEEAQAAHRQAQDAARKEGFEAARRELQEQARREAAEVARQAEVAARARLEEAQAAHRQAQEAARKEGFEAARRELGERARQELARRAQAEARARQEAVAAAQRETGELVQRRDEEARRRGEAEEKARAEAQARRVVEEQLQTLRDQLDLERKRAEERVATVMQRAAEEEEAAEELRRMAEDEIQRRDEAQARTRADEEEKLRSAVAAARAELEALRRQGEEETRRRAEAEAALARLEETRREERRREETRLAEARREEARRAAPPPAPPAFAPPSFLGPFEEAEAEDRPVPEPMPARPVPAAEPVLPADPAEEAARRRVAALRAPSEPQPAAPALRPAPGERLAPPAAPATPLPPEPAPAAAPEPEEPPRSLAPPAAALRAGELAELPAPRLLALAARTQLEGRLDFQGAVTRSLWFEGGRVVGAGSADPSERLEEVALRVGLITRDQHRQIAQASSALPSRRAALLLLERGFIKPGELTGLARRRTEEVVFGVFGEPGGPFRWVGAEVPPEERTALERGTLALAVEGVRRRWLAPQLDALLGGPATLLAPSPEPVRPAELGLSAEERRALALADGLRTLDEIVEASPLDPLTTRQLLAALVAVGGLSVRILHQGRPAGRAAVEIDLARVKDKLDQVRRADYFTVLGVGRLCTPHEVREAANRLLAEFDPLRLAGVADEGLPARLVEIGQVVRDAREVLANDRLRGEYLRGLGDAG